MYFGYYHHPSAETDFFRNHRYLWQNSNPKLEVLSQKLSFHGKYGVSACLLEPEALFRLAIDFWFKPSIENAEKIVA